MAEDPLRLAERRQRLGPPAPEKVSRGAVAPSPSAAPSSSRPRSASQSIDGAYGGDGRRRPSVPPQYGNGSARIPGAIDDTARPLRAGQADLDHPRRLRERARRTARERNGKHLGERALAVRRSRRARETQRGKNRSTPSLARSPTAYSGADEELHSRRLSALGRLRRVAPRSPSWRRGRSRRCLRRRRGPRGTAREARTCRARKPPRAVIPCTAPLLGPPLRQCHPRTSWRLRRIRAAARGVPSCARA